MAVVLLVLGFYLIYPVILILINTFNVAHDALVPPKVWGLDNWRHAFDDPRLLRSLGNTIMIWGLTVGISFPVAVIISWTLARTRIPFSHGLEFMFWVSYMMPGIATAVAWINLMDPDLGLLNKSLEFLPFVDQGPFNIFSVPGIVWTQLMANGVSIKVMLLTPAFRNMDSSLEEAARVSGSSNIRTMMRVTLPLMISPMVLVFALQMLRIFQSFEIELLLGIPFDFFVYSTLIYEYVRISDVPEYGRAAVLASLTLAIVALIIPFQRWILGRRQYTTIRGQFKPGLIDLGAWNWIAFGIIGFLLVLLTVGPAISLLVGSMMTRMGFFSLDPAWTLRHWTFVFQDSLFLNALRTTLIMAFTAAIFSPLLFSVVAYIIVRTRWAGRGLLDIIIWGSGAIPGILSGLGLLWLFVGTPGINVLYGTIWALLLVVIIQGNTTGTNIMKGVLVQVGQDMEDAARISGAGWVRTYIKIWIPLIMPTLILLSMINFALAASTTSSIILISSRDVMTLSILALEYSSPGLGLREEAGIVALFITIMTAGLALVARHFGLRMGLQQR
jgi:iron(III) transport system permease protein